MLYVPKYSKNNLVDLPTLMDVVKRSISWRCWSIKTKRLCNCGTPDDCPMTSFCENWLSMEEQTN